MKKPRPGDVALFHWQPESGGANMAALYLGNGHVVRFSSLADELVVTRVVRPGVVTRFRSYLP